MEVDSSEASTVEQIDWPFLKSQREMRDDNSSHDGDHFEIVVSNVEDVTEGLHFSSNDETVGSDSNFETCLISAGLADLATSDTIKLGSITNNSQNDQVEYDSVEYFTEGPGALSNDMEMSEDPQKLIKVYQAAVDSHDSKLITVYEIKPEAEGDPNSIGGRDVFVEIVASPEDALMRNSLTSDGTLLLESTENIPSSHLTIPASMAAAMGLSSNQIRNMELSSSARSSVSSSTEEAASVSELKCTICGFSSYDREEIGAHCVEFHDLFFCPSCNLVFKRRPSLASHMRNKHGIVLNSQKPKNLSSVTYRSRVNKKSAVVPVLSNTNSSASITSQASKLLQTHLASSNKQISCSPQTNSSISPDILVQLPTHPIQPNLLVTPTRHRASGELVPVVRNILSKNRAVLPNTTLLVPGSRQKKAANRGRRQYNVWSRALDQQPLVLDSRLSDPATRNQFNIEFAKKITSTGVGVEAFGIAQDRLPSLRGTYCLEIKEIAPENNDSATNGDITYSYTIESLNQNTDCCKVICGQCNFSNPRIENVLFHCEIDHKQYYCQNKKCQLGFGTWDSLMKHMKNMHKEDNHD